MGKIIKQQISRLQIAYLKWYHRNPQHRPFKAWTQNNNVDYTKLLNTVKHEIQYYALNKWKQNEFVGVIEMATGVGKTRIGCLGSQRLALSGNVDFTLIATPTTYLRDTGWPTEYEYWASKTKAPVHIDGHVQYDCYDSARKLKNDQIDLIVADEVHRLVSKENIKLLSKNNWKYFLGLTATMPYEKRNILNNKFGIPVVFKYTIEEAIKDGVLAESTRINYLIQMSANEKIHYQTYEDKLKKIESKYLNISTGLIAPGRWFSKALDIVKAGHENASDSETFKDARQYLKVINARKQFLSECYDKTIQTTKLINSIVPTLNDNQLIIVFSEFINPIKNLKKELEKREIKDIAIYHGEQNKTEQKENLKLVNSGKAKVLLSAKALAEGFNLPSLTYGIVMSGNSTKLLKTQQEGRVCRAKEGKTATFINLLCKDTQDIKWNKSAYYGKNMDNIITIDNDFNKLINIINND